MKTILLITFIVISCNLLAKQIGDVTGLAIPRFVSLKSDEVNLRIGPSINYPIVIKYVKQNIPVEIIEEHDVWRKVKDFNKNIGWIHKSLIQGDRYALIISSVSSNYNIHNRPNGKVIGHINNNNIVELKKCIENWCLVEHKILKGWILKSNIWGAYKKEMLNVRFNHRFVEFYWKICENKFVKYIINFLEDFSMKIFSAIKK